MVVPGNRKHDVAVADIEVEFRPAHESAFAAVVRLRGEHDIATSAGISETLAPIDGNVLVDLSDCAFVESTVITVFVADSRERARKGQRLELVVPTGNATITRTLQVSGLSELLTVHKTHEFTTNRT